MNTGNTLRPEIGEPLTALRAGEVGALALGDVTNGGDMETKTAGEEYKSVFVGRLADLGLGNPEGIPSRLADATDEQLTTFVEELIQKLKVPDSLGSHSCIDGRRKLGTADGGTPMTLLRRVGGSASNLGVALNGGVISTADMKPDVTIMKFAKQIDNSTGLGRRCHSGGCGGAGGEVADNQAIAEEAKIESATLSFLAIPEVGAYFGHPDTGLIPEVRNNARGTASFLESKGWNGEDYVGSLSPSEVDILQGDPEDHKHHGHREDAVVIILGKKTLTDGVFVWNCAASMDAFNRLARGTDEATQQGTILAEVMKHLATTDRLVSPKTPVIISSAT